MKTITFFRCILLINIKSVKIWVTIFVVYKVMIFSQQILLSYLVVSKLREFIDPANVLSMSMFLW